MERVEGRVAFVTGAASGIGLAIAGALIEAGACVVLADWDAASLERECSRLGKAALGQRLDVRDRASWQAAKLVTERAFGPLEILVNNAGVAPDWSELVDMDTEHFDRLLAIMLTGAFNGIHCFGATMRERGDGHIVNTASMMGVLAPPRQGAYVAAKWGLVGMTESLRAELTPHGVGVSLLLPGSVRSNLLVGNEPPFRSSDEGMDAGLVAAQVLTAIRTNQLYVVTHTEHRSLVATRNAELLRAFDRSPSGVANATGRSQTG